MLFVLSWLQKKLDVNDLPDTQRQVVFNRDEDIFYGFFKNEKKTCGRTMKVKYRVEVVQTNVFYIEAETEGEALRSACEDYVWDEDQQAPNFYRWHHTIEEVAQ